MAANWWKYGLCVFGGLGVGFAVGVKITKNRSEEEYEQKINDIREIYRNDRRASAPKKKQKPEPEQPEISTKTSIQMEKLSQKKAEQAESRYGSAFQNKAKPGTEEEELTLDDIPEGIVPMDTMREGITIVDELPEDSDHAVETLKYYSDGVLTYAVTDKKVPEEDISEMIGNPGILKRLGKNGLNQLRVVNDHMGIDYTIIYLYQTWASVAEEEPYKEEQ